MCSENKLHSLVYTRWFSGIRIPSSFVDNATLDFICLYTLTRIATSDF